MSVSLDISEARLQIGVLKVALALVFFFVLIAIALTLHAGRGQGVAVSSLLVCIGFSFLANGVLASLKIVDWFEDRRAKKNG